MTFLKETLKKPNTIASLLMLILLTAFLVISHDAFVKDARYYNGIKGETVPSGTPRDYIDINGDEVFSQNFIAIEKKVKGITLFFENPNVYKTNGTVKITLLDSKGNKLADGSNNTQNIHTEKRIYFYFNQNENLSNANGLLRSQSVLNDERIDGISVNRGEEYTLNIEFIGVKKADKIRFRIAETDDPLDGFWMMQNGEELQGNVLFSSIIYRQFYKRQMILMLLVILMSIVIVLLPIESISRKLAHNISFVLLIMMFIVGPLLCCWISLKIMDLTSKGIVVFMCSPYGLMNLAIAILFTAVLFLVTNSLKITSIISVFAFYLLSIACYALIQFRNIPLRASDFTDIGTAMDVAGNYTLYVNTSFLWITVVTACYIAIAFSLKGHKGLAARKRIVAAVLVSALSFGFLTFIYDNNTIKHYALNINAFNPTLSYQEMGYILAFAESFNDLTIDKPSGYSAAEVERTMSDYQSDESISDTKVSEQAPNIIAIMNEAYSDLSVLGKLETNEPYMPFFDSLSDNTVKGTMYSSVFAGGTANSEYEFLTGNTIAFLRFKTAYTMLINNEIPSLCKTLSAQGYKGLTAFHPGRVDSYNRDNVYPYMGFNKYISIEDIESPKTLRDFMSDEGDYGIVMNEYEKHKKSEFKESPFFMFNVTIQNHSPFTYATGVVDSGIEILDKNLNYEEVGQYLNLIKKSDEALEDLINYFSNAKEPTHYCLVR